MKKILIINPEIPYPLTSGGKQGVFHFIDKLRSIYDISLLFINSNRESYEELKLLWPNVIFYSFEPPIIPQKKQSFISKIYNLPYKIKDKIINRTENKAVDSDFVKTNSMLNHSLPIMGSLEMLDYITKVANQNFDIIQIEFYSLISLIHILPRNVEKIFIHHELRYVRNELEMAFFREINSYDKYLFNVSKQFEIENLKLYDKIVTVTDIDKSKLETELENKLIFSSPSMINMPEGSLKYKYKFNNRLTFVGSYKHFPNEDGIKWFIANVWKELCKKQPQLELHIIGGGWNIEMFHDILPFKNVLFDGYVEDLQDILPNSIAIIPIRIGSGMRMKIIDAVNFRIPFVTTSIGVEGLDFKDSFDCFISDTPKKFVRDIESLIGDLDLQTKFIKNSQTTLNNMYNSDILLEKRKNVYEYNNN